MIKVVIIEDEIPARKKLIRFIDSLDGPTEVIAEINTIAKGVEFLSRNYPDLIFSDIELLDGNVFEIFKQVDIKCPIIFTTAYDQFWMDAFDSNGIDYLLKPFTLDRFQKAWNKWQLLRTNDNRDLFDTLTKFIEEKAKPKVFKKRFTIQSHQSIYFLETENIVYFEAIEGVIFAHDASGKRHLLSIQTLKEIEAILDPSEFFKINRGEIVQKIFVEKLERYTKNTISIKLKGSKKHLVTSQSCTAEFKRWLEE